MLISADMPGAMTDAAFTGFRGILACFTPAREIFIPPMVISGGGGAEQSFSLSLQVSFRPISAAARREISRSGLPLSTHPRIRLVVPSGSGRETAMTVGVWAGGIGAG